MLSGLVDLFERRADKAVVPAPKSPPSFTPQLPDHDDVDDAVGYDLADCLGVAWGLVYEDAEGFVSRRRVTVRRISQAHETLYLQSYCHERKAPRSFRVDRVRELVHLGTGEVIEDASAFFKALLAQDPTGTALDRRRAGLQAIVFLAGADGDLDDRERMVAVDYIAELCPPGECDLERIVSFVEALYPDEEVFRKSLGIIGRWDVVEAKRLLKALHRTACVDGVLDPQEFDWLMQAEQFIG